MLFNATIFMCMWNLLIFEVIDVKKLTLLHALAINFFIEYVRRKIIIKEHSKEELNKMVKTAFKNNVWSSITRLVFAIIIHIIIITY